VVPFNIASYALLLELICRVTGYTPGVFTWFGADVHLYENQLDQTREQLSREPLPLSKLDISRTSFATLTEIEPSDVYLFNYQHHPTISAPMAV